MRLSRAARGPELLTKTQNEDAYYYNIFIANQANQTESTTATWHSLVKSPYDNGFIQRARMRETS